jgi:Protein of unknown function (DUF760)
MKYYSRRRRPVRTASVTALFLIVSSACRIRAFQRTTHFGHPPVKRHPLHKPLLPVLYSSVGGDSGDRPPPSGGNRGSGGNGENRRNWDEFLNRDGDESENMIQAREYMSENSLPISYYTSVDGEALNGSMDVSASSTNSSALVANTPKDSALAQEEAMMASNPYMAVVTNISPSDLIAKFTATAHPRVQNAVRSTILGLIGGLPKMAFETATITTGQKLASLMFQLQMTGYMFKVRVFRPERFEGLAMLLIWRQRDGAPDDAPFDIL